MAIATHLRSSAGTLVRGCVLALALTGGGAAARADASEAADEVRVLIDVSGSMKRNDPSNLRRAALRLLVRLLPAGTRAGVWTFGRYVSMDIAPAPVDAAWRKRAEQGAAQIHSRGLFTNIEDALARSTWDWKRPAARAARHLILLTDGMVDVSEDPAQSDASRQRIVTEIIPRLTAAGVHLHTVALSERADEALLRLMAAETDAAHASTDDAERLQRIFLHILERTTPVDTVPIEGNEFTIDASVKEMTLLVFAGAAATARSLVDPAGVSIDADTPRETVNWRRDDGYDLVTVRAPASGRWRIVGDVNPDNRVVVVTDLKLRWQRPPNVVAPDRALELRAWLSDGEQRLEGDALASLSAARVEHWPSAGEPRTEALAKPGPDSGGEFVAAVAAPHEAGDHQLVLTVDGGTFIRQLRHTFSVLAPASAEVTALGPAEYRVSVTPATGLLEPESLEVRAWLTDPSGVRTELDAATGSPGHTIALEPLAAAGTHELRIAVRGRSPTGRVVESALAPIALAGPAPPAAATPRPTGAVPGPAPDRVLEAQAAAASASPGWPVIAAALLGINALAGLLVFLGLRWARRGAKPAAAAVAAADEPAADEVAPEPTAVAEVERMPDLAEDELELWDSDADLPEDGLDPAVSTALADSELMEFQGADDLLDAGAEFEQTLAAGGAGFNSDPEAETDPALAPEAAFEPGADPGIDAAPDQETDTERGLGSESELDLEADAELDLEADAELDLEADAELDLEADAELDLEADAELDLEADAELDQEADAELDLEVDAAFDPGGEEPFDVGPGTAPPETPSAGDELPQTTAARA